MRRVNVFNIDCELAVVCQQSADLEVNIYVFEDLKIKVLYHVRDAFFIPFTEFATLSIR